MSENQPSRKTAQDIQDEIFERMTADEKVAVGALLWRLAKDLVGDKISYAERRSQTSARQNRRNS